MELNDKVSTRRPQQTAQLKSKMRNFGISGNWRSETESKVVVIYQETMKTSQNTLIQLEQLVATKKVLQSGRLGVGQ